MFHALRSTQRNKLTSSIFSSTFALCFALVGANSLLPCPMDAVHSNDSVPNERLLK
ncbi:hypothetical protein HYPBUDRAFT_92331, partial [Hyphopichia burtonii NRRL Y-1933]